jgi:hypothetical protein
MCYGSSGTVHRFRVAISEFKHQDDFERLSGTTFKVALSFTRPMSIYRQQVLFLSLFL